MGYCCWRGGCEDGEICILIILAHAGRFGIPIPTAVLDDPLSIDPGNCFFYCQMSVFSHAVRLTYAVNARITGLAAPITSLICIHIGDSAKSRAVLTQVSR